MSCPWGVAQPEEEARLGSGVEGKTRRSVGMQSPEASGTKGEPHGGTEGGLQPSVGAPRRLAPHDCYGGAVAHRDQVAKKHSSLMPSKAELKPCTYHAAEEYALEEAQRESSAKCHAASLARAAPRHHGQAAGRPYCALAVSRHRAHDAKKPASRNAGSSHRARRP